jgi:hypothetical protein
MTNAKTELQEYLKDKAKIKCAKIHREDSYGEPVNDYKLSLNYTDADLEKFFASLDFQYDSGYGGQELHGIVWLEDGTWFSRGEYDGSEWWEHNVLPSIPDDLIVTLVS